MGRFQGGSDTRSPAEQLSDLKQLKKAVASQRTHELRLLNSKGYRKREVRQTVKAIRSLTAALGREFKRLAYLRTSTNGVLGQTIDAYDSRIAELNVEIIHIEQRAKIARYSAIQEQIAKAAEELPDDMLEYAEVS